jgi:hypothetical protein
MARRSGVNAALSSRIEYLLYVCVELALMCPGAKIPYQHVTVPFPSLCIILLLFLFSTRSSFTVRPQYDEASSISLLFSLSVCQCVLAGVWLGMSSVYGSTDSRSTVTDGNLIRHFRGLFLGSRYCMAAVEMTIILIVLFKWMRMQK